MIDLFTHKVICVATGHGHQHDFALFKAARLPLLPAIALLADSGYQGVAKNHPNSHTPHKNSKHKPLSPQQKQENRQLSHERIVVEHTLRYLKRFRILAATYRNRRKRFALRVHLLAAIANLHK